jgi:hypothetical protein
MAAVAVVAGDTRKERERERERERVRLARKRKVAFFLGPLCCRG